MNAQTKQRFRRSAVFLALLLLGVILCALLLYLRARSRPTDPLPDPNGYELIRRAAMQVGDRLDDPEALPDEVLKKYLETNSAALQLAREGMALSCAVPIEFTEEWIASQTLVMMGFRDLGYALAAESMLNRREGRTEEAVSSALDLVRLGYSVGNRGVLIDFLIGTACEIQGAHLLTNMLSDLDHTHCRTVVATLEELDGSREPADSMFRRERRWMVATGGFLEYVKTMAEDRTLRPERDTWWDSTGQVNARLGELREMRIQIAARAFELEHGRRPANTSELVPEFLSNTPLDPETRQPLKLSPPKE